jgi:hypothetical protein
MKTLLEFDDAGAPNDHPAKGVTFGDIRAWHDEMERMKESIDLQSARYDRILSSWAECRDLLSKERAITAKADSALERIFTGRVNDGRVRLVDQNGTEVIGTGPACAGCKQVPRPDCDNPACAFAIQTGAGAFGVVNT